MTGFFEKGPGNRSMMRLLAFLGFLLGTVVSIWGMALLTVAIIEVSTGKTEVIATMGTIALIISGGMALAAGGEALKMIQHRSEVKETVSTIESEDGTREERSHEVVLESGAHPAGSGGGRGGI